jgi:hypothetical protein
MAEKEALQWKVHVGRVDYAGDSGWQLPTGAYQRLLVTGNEGQFWKRCQVTVLVLEMHEASAFFAPCNQSSIPMVISIEK